MWSNDEVKAVVKRNDCWELEMKMQKKDVCKLTRKEDKSRGEWRKGENRSLML